ncbi:hypothetical protein [Legionella sp. 29fVS95]|uniref:hypothetical protein n=1 Tax=Legionella sp. 29fVS95 TaxID=3402813 RepID=UPI003AF9BC50
MPTRKTPYSHIYEARSSINLAQGDIIHLNDDLSEEFRKHYNIEFDLQYIMILSQTCDLVKGRNKINHINVCIVRPFKNFILREAKKLKHKEISGYHLIKKQEYKELVNVVYKLINNSDAKSHLYLPKKPPFEEEMVAVFGVNYPLRFDKYDLLLNNRVLSVKNDFKAKIGQIISTLYHRVTVSEVTDLKGWQKNKLLDCVVNILDSFGFISVKNEIIDELEEIDIPKQKLKKRITTLEENLKNSEKKDELIKAYGSIKALLLDAISKELDKEKSVVDVEVVSSRIEKRLNRLFRK